MEQQFARALPFMYGFLGTLVIIGGVIIYTHRPDVPEYANIAKPVEKTWEERKAERVREDKIKEHADFLRRTFPNDPGDPMDRARAAADAKDRGYNTQKIEPERDTGWDVIDMIDRANAAKSPPRVSGVIIITR